MRWPLSGWRLPYSLRMAMRPGISFSASSISLRPQSASVRSFTWNSSFRAGVFFCWAMRWSSPCGVSVVGVGSVRVRFEAGLSGALGRAVARRSAGPVAPGSGGRGRTAGAARPAAARARARSAGAKPRRAWPSGGRRARRRGGPGRPPPAGPPGLRMRAASASAGADVGDVGEHQHQERRVAGGVGERQRVEPGPVELDVVDPGQPAAGRLEHGGRLVDRRPPGPRGAPARRPARRCRSRGRPPSSRAAGGPAAPRARSRRP